VEYIRLRSSMADQTALNTSNALGLARSLTESDLRRVERQSPDGLTSIEILRVFAEVGVPLSEATLRKYVQLGLLPRSVRVGRKGKHQGSQGIYPVSVVRQIWQIKQMMANDYTIEQIQREVLFMRSDLELLDRTLGGIFLKLDGALNGQRSDVLARLVTRKVNDAKTLSTELKSRLEAIERQLTTKEAISVSAS
jgi:DNA-binding transcriptional MerR regulator